MAYRNLHPLFHSKPDDGAGAGAGDGGTEDGSDGAGAGTGTGDGSGDGDGAGAGDGSGDDSELAKTRREAAKYRVEAKKAQERIAELEGKDKTDTEKARDAEKAAKAEAKALQEENNRLRVQVLASKVGIVPDAITDAAKLLDWSEIEDPSDDKQLERALKALVKDKPYLLGNVPGGSDGGAGGNGKTGTQDMNDLLRRAAGRS